MISQTVNRFGFNQPLHGKKQHLEAVGKNWSRTASLWAVQEIVSEPRMTSIAQQNLLTKKKIPK